MFLEENRKRLNSQDNKILIQKKNLEKKEINNINIPLLNVKEKLQQSNNYLPNKVIQNKLFNPLNNIDNLIQNFKKLKNIMKNFDKNNFIDIKGFKRNLFINYSDNNKFENNYLTEKNNSPSKILNNNSNTIIGIKTNRKEENELENNLNLNENNPLVSFKDGILRIDKDEINDSYQNNLERIQNNKSVKIFF